MARSARVVDEFTLESDRGSVAVRKLRTPNGERLELDDGDDRIRLDALELESLTWQDDAFFEDTLGVPDRPTVAVSADAVREAARYKIGNEYTTVWIRLTADGDRLLLSSAKMGFATHVGPAELAALARRDQAFFTGLLDTPLGPEGDSPIGFGH